MSATRPVSSNLGSAVARDPGQCRSPCDCKGRGTARASVPIRTRHESPENHRVTLLRLSRLPGRATARRMPADGPLVPLKCRDDTDAGAPLGLGQLPALAKPGSIGTGWWSCGPNWLGARGSRSSRSTPSSPTANANESSTPTGRPSMMRSMNAMPSNDFRRWSTSSTRTATPRLRSAWPTISTRSSSACATHPATAAGGEARTSSSDPSARSNDGPR